MKDDILIANHFASPGETHAIIEAFTRCRRKFTHEEAGDKFFEHRVMWASSYPAETELEARSILRTWARYATVKVAEFFEEPAIYCDGIQTVIWDGPAMPPHQDDRHPNPNESHGTPWRFLASVIYLNDDYEGGEIYFPERRHNDVALSIKPKAGQLIAFPGAWWHGVNAVTKGVRYTSPAWYSREPQNEDPFIRR